MDWVIDSSGEAISIRHQSARVLSGRDVRDPGVSWRNLVRSHTVVDYVCKDLKSKHAAGLRHVTRCFNLEREAVCKDAARTWTDERIRDEEYLR